MRRHNRTQDRDYLDFIRSLPCVICVLITKLRWRICSTLFDLAARICPLAGAISGRGGIGAAHHVGNRWLSWKVEVQPLPRIEVELSQADVAAIQEVTHG